MIKKLLILFAIPFAFFNVRAEQVIKAPEVVDERLIIISTTNYLSDLDASRFDSSWEKTSPDLKKQ